MDLDQERQLVAHAQTDQQYFGQLFDAYYPSIVNYIAKRTGDAALAQDLAAETFFKAMNGLPKFKWQGVSISNWFYRIAINEIRMYYRKNKYQPASLEALFAEGFEVADEDDFTQEIIAAQDALERHTAFQQARELLSTLPLKYQEVITLRYTEKKKLREIAMILGKKEGTVKSLLNRGLSQLRKAMEQAAVQPNEAGGIIPNEGHLTVGQEAYEEQ